MEISHLIELLGYILQVYGIAVGGTGLVVERIHGYSVFRGLLDVVPRLITRDSFPLLLFLPAALSGPPSGDDTYAILNLPATLFAYLFIVVWHVVWFFTPLLLPVGLILDISWMKVVGIIGFVIASAIHAVTGITQTMVRSGQDTSGEPGRGSIQHTLRNRPMLAMRLIARSWIRSPATSVKATGTILLLTLSHWPAWMNGHVDLSDRSQRDRYYAVVSLLSLLLGTILLGIAATLWH